VRWCAGRVSKLSPAPDETKVASRIDRFTDADRRRTLVIHDMLTGALERIQFDGGPICTVWGPTTTVFTSQRLGTFDPSYGTSWQRKAALRYAGTQRFPMDGHVTDTFFLWQGFAAPTIGLCVIIPVDSGQKPYLFIDSMFD
jgi:hypothetical protein